VTGQDLVIDGKPPPGDRAEPDLMVTLFRPLEAVARGGEESLQLWRQAAAR
jgi:hypothetical protein